MESLYHWRKLVSILFTSTFPPLNNSIWPFHLLRCSFSQTNAVLTLSLPLVGFSIVLSSSSDLSYYSSYLQLEFRSCSLSSSLLLLAYSLSLTRSIFWLGPRIPRLTHLFAFLKNSPGNWWWRSLLYWKNYSSWNRQWLWKRCLKKNESNREIKQRDRKWLSETERGKKTIKKHSHHNMSIVPHIKRFFA